MKQWMERVGERERGREKDAHGVSHRQAHIIAISIPHIGIVLFYDDSTIRGICRLLSNCLQKYFFDIEGFFRQKVDKKYMYIGKKFNKKPKIITQSEFKFNQMSGVWTQLKFLYKLVHLYADKSTNLYLEMLFSIRKKTLFYAT